MTEHPVAWAVLIAVCCALVALLVVTILDWRRK
jgi:hypothetical protein